MKHGFWKTAAAVAAAVFLCTGAQAAEAAPQVSAKSAILVDAQAGSVLYEKNADEKSLIASTTKIMTGLLVCEDGNLEREISVAPEASGVEGSSLYLKAGERITVRELLYGMMLRSGNDAAVALAAESGGSVEAFVQRMNERARELCLTRTHFANPNGLDSEENYSTARDLAKLCAAAMENETFRAVVGCKSMTAGSRSFTNHNKLLWRVDGCDGIKTGYTKKAGRILASGACRDGRRLICVTICDPDDWRDHAALYDYGFSAFTPQTVVEEGAVVGEIPVVGSKTARVSLLAGKTVRLCLAQGETAEMVLHAPGFVYAPVLPGQAGWLEVRVNGNCAQQVPVYYAQTAEEIRPARGFWKRLFGG